MLKFENIAKVGQTIRAYDFKPMIGRSDCFVEGKVLAIDNSQGYKAFKIRVSKDVFDNKEFTESGYGSRVTKEVFVPMQVSFMEYDARIINLSE
jgi:hypothetical protein